MRIKLIVNSLIIFAASYILHGCQSVVKDVKLPEQKPKLVVTCFISPSDSLISVRVMQSTPLYNYIDNSPDKNISNATVEISDGSKTTTMTFDYNTYCYTCKTSDFPLESGKTYYLKVTAPTFDKVDATCTIPSTTNTSTSIDALDSTLKTNYNFTNIVYSLKFHFTDIANEINYYRVFINTETVKDTSMYGYYNDVIFYLDRNKEISSDKNNDGSITNFNATAYASTPAKFKKITFYLLTTDRNYYEYYHSLSNYSSDNPFSEPTMIYSNINGGFGVFAGYNSSVTVRNF